MSRWDLAPDARTDVPRNVLERQSLVGAVAVLLAVIAGDVRAAPEPVPTPDGEALFVSECASCHGRAGRGDGPDAFLFLPKPTDLRGGVLEGHQPERLVRRILDGATLRLPFDPGALRVWSQQTEAVVAHLERIPRLDWRVVTQGQRIYMTRCQICHGAFGHLDAEPSGDPKHSPTDLSASAFQRSLTDAELVTAVRHERPRMPPIPTVLEADDVQALVAFVRALSPGFELYSSYCAICHGTDGRPAHIVETARRPTVTFDAAYFAHTDPEHLRVAAWHMLVEKKPMMPHFRGALSESGARAIIDYLRKAP